MAFMKQLHQQEPINMTAALEALSPFLNNPRRTVIQAEAFTAGVIMLLLLQLILGSFRRQSSGSFVQAGTWVTYTLSFPAIAYTLGLMQSSPVKNVMYPIWAVSLVLAAGCTNAVKVYEIADNKQWKRSSFDFHQYAVYSAMICWLLFPYSLNIKEYLHDYFKRLAPASFFGIIKSPAIAVTLLAASVMYTALMGRELACVWVEFGYFRVRRVAKFMKNLATATNDDGFDPATMKGYNYPVHFIGIASDNPITIDQIWQCEGRLLGSGTHCTGLKDVCLAYAMYQLLKRRYYGMACAEEHLPETRDFVLKGLLRTEDDYERAFRIVEVELGFCHDYFFTKHAIIFELEALFFFLFLVRIVLIAIVVSFVLQSSLSVKTSTAIIEVHTKRADEIITFLVLGTILLIELLQAALYMASDWCKVSVACRYVTGSWYQDNAFIEKLLRYLGRFTIFGYWKNRIDQYSVIPDNTAADMAGDSDPVNMLQRVKRAIARSLRSCDGLPTNGEGSLRLNGLPAGEFSWALQGQSQAEIMLIWHIATDYCNIAPTSGEHVNGTSANEEETKFHRQVSVSLSRYCAYLMDSAPELLPGYFGDTKLTMADVKHDASKVSTCQDVYQALQDREEDMSIFMRGVKLGKQLEGMPGSTADRWKVLADFWAEKILYVAPSDNVNGHMERLAKGGELLTHIFVLLTHAGILKINREEDKNTMPSQPSQENV